MVGSIELRPHIAGYRQLPDGTEQVIEFDQWILMVDGIQGGYVQKKDDGGIMLIRRFSDDDRAEIKRLVESTTEQTKTYPTQPPPPHDEGDHDDET